MRFIFVALFILLLIGWILGFIVFHVASALIHLMLLFAVIALVVHFARRHSTA